MLRSDVEGYDAVSVVFQPPQGKGEEMYQANIRTRAGEETIRFSPPVSAEEVSRALLSASGAQNVYAQRGWAKDYGSLDPLWRIGEALFSSVFGGRAAPVYRRAREMAEADERGLRVEIISDDPTLDVMPWEFLHDRQDFISLSLWSPVVRVRPVHVATRPRLAPLSDQVRVLVVAAEPREFERMGAGPLHLRPLIHEVEALTKAYPQLNLSIEFNATPNQLWETARARDYNVLCLVGLSRETDKGVQALVLRDEQGGTVALDGAILRQLTWEWHNLSLIHLCLARSDTLARELAADCPNVIGIRGDITSASAIAFTRGVLTGILGGAPVEAAVTVGRQQIDVASPGSREWGLPVLYTYMPPGSPLYVRQAKKEPAGAHAESRRETAVSPERRKLEIILDVRRKNLAALLDRRASAGSTAYLEMQIKETEAQIAALEQELQNLT